MELGIPHATMYTWANPQWVSSQKKKGYSKPTLLTLRMQPEKQPNVSMQKVALFVGDSESILKLYEQIFGTRS